jgi:hypothetical protein
MKKVKNTIVAVGILTATLFTNSIFAAENKMSSNEMQEIKILEQKLAEEYLNFAETTLKNASEAQAQVRIYDQQDQLVTSGNLQDKKVKELLLKADFLTETDGISLYRINN